MQTIVPSSKKAVPALSARPKVSIAFKGMIGVCAWRRSTDSMMVASMRRDHDAVVDARLERWHVLTRGIRIWRAMRAVQASVRVRGPAAASQGRHRDISFAVVGAAALMQGRAWNLRGDRPGMIESRAQNQEGPLALFYDLEKNVRLSRAWGYVDYNRRSLIPITLLFPTTLLFPFLDGVRSNPISAVNSIRS